MKEWLLDNTATPFPRHVNWRIFGIFPQKDFGGNLKPNNCPREILRLLGGHYRILIKNKFNRHKIQEIYLLGQNDLTVIPWNLGKKSSFYSWLGDFKNNWSMRVSNI